MLCSVTTCPVDVVGLPKFGLYREVGCFLEMSLTKVSCIWLIIEKVCTWACHTIRYWKRARKKYIGM